MSLLCWVMLATSCRGHREPELKTDQQKTLYALGRATAHNLEVYGLTPEEWEIVKSGMNAAMVGQPSDIDGETYALKIQGLMRSRAAQTSRAERERGQRYEAQAAQEPGAIRAESGVIFISRREGSGALATESDAVKVHYQGKLVDGHLFSNSVEPGFPTDFMVKSMIPCWKDAVQRMRAGGKAHVICPSAAAYGDVGRPPRIPGGATLTYDLELVEIKPKCAPVAAAERE